MCATWEPTKLSSSRPAFQSSIKKAKVLKTDRSFELWEFQDQFGGQFLKLYRLKGVPGPSLALKSSFLTDN